MGRFAVGSLFLFCAGVCAVAGPVTTIDRERAVALLDGEPFFPLGLFGVPEAHMPAVAAAGFNCVIRWKTVPLKTARARRNRDA